MNDEKRNPDTYNANGNEKWMLYQFLVVPDREASKEKVAYGFKGYREKELVKEKLAYIYGFKGRVL